MAKIRNKPEFVIEETGPVLLWRLVPDPVAKKKGQAMAKAIKKQLAGTEQRSLEEIMAEIRGRSW